MSVYSKNACSNFQLFHSFPLINLYLIKSTNAIWNISQYFGTYGYRRKQNTSTIVDLHEILQNRLKEVGFSKLTHLQVRAIRAIETGKDVIIHAETGSGKTMAFLLPLLNRIYKLHDLLLFSIQTENSSLKNDVEKKSDCSIRNFRRLLLQWNRSLPSTFYQSIGSAKFSEEIKNQGSCNDKSDTLHANPLHHFRPWVVLTPNRDLAAQICSLIRCIDICGRVSIQTLNDLTEFPMFYEDFNDTRKRCSKRINFEKANVNNGTYEPKSEQILISDIISHNLNSRITRQKLLIPRDSYSNNSSDCLMTSNMQDSKIEKEILGKCGNIKDKLVNLYNIPIFSGSPNIIKFERLPVISSPRIRWGAVDIVICTAEAFVRDMERFSIDNLIPSCIVFDEVDFLFQNNATRKLIMDIIRYIRPRLPIRFQGMPKITYFPVKECQFIHVGASIPAMGVTTVGCMLTERFCTAVEVRSNGMHRIPSCVKQRWILLDDDKIEEAYIEKRQKHSNDEQPCETGNKLLQHVDFNVQTRKLEQSEYRQASFDHRLYILIGVLQRLAVPRTLIFVDTIYHCRELYTFLKRHGWPVLSFHKGMTMCSRMAVLRKFFNLTPSDAKTGLHGTQFMAVLIATDLASRGIDMRGVDHVINFNFPTDAITYLHRAGRTSRLGNNSAPVPGIVTNFIAKEDMKLMEAIQECQKSQRSLQSVFSRSRSLRTRWKRKHLEQLQPSAKEDANQSPMTENFDVIHADTHDLEQLWQVQEDFYRTYRNSGNNFIHDDLHDQNENDEGRQIEELRSKTFRDESDSDLEVEDNDSKEYEIKNNHQNISRGDIYKKTILGKSLQKHTQKYPGIRRFNPKYRSSRLLLDNYAAEDVPIEDYVNL